MVIIVDERHEGWSGWLMADDLMDAGCFEGVGSMGMQWDGMNGHT